MPTPLTITLLGSGTSAGVPMIGCHCATCSSPDPRDHRTRPSIALSYLAPDSTPHTILVDTSPELRLQAVREKIDRISAIVFTHAHADHIFGLDDVRRYNTLAASPLPVHAAPDALSTLLRCFPYAFQPQTPSLPSKDSIYRPELVAHPITAPFDLFGQTWTPLHLPHGGTRVLGFRVGDFAYCTDCNEIPPAARAQLQNLDTLIIDALRPRPHPSHLSFEEALQTIAYLKPRRAFFTHLSHDMTHAAIEATLPPSVRVSYDGLKITVPSTPPRSPA